MFRNSLALAPAAIFLVATTPAQIEWVARPSPIGIGSEMVYDSARDRLVKFGGNRLGFGDDTWEWDGVSWTLRKVAGRPPARFGHALAYDSARQRVVLFAGQGPFGDRLSDTWEWDGVSWTEVDSPVRPSARSSHAMTYDAVRQRVLMFGGCAASPLSYLSDTWEWDGAVWKQLATGTSPAARCGHRMVYEEARRSVLLFGGEAFVGASTVNFTDTWEWNGATWSEQQTTASPPFGGPMAYDVSRERVVLFRSGLPGLVEPETWEWDGADWAEVQPIGPAPGLGEIMAYDSGRRRVVLLASPDGRPETWEWDGTAWSQIAPALGPPIRVGHAMAYDESRGRLVLFGGNDEVKGVETSTWEWDGRLWTAHQPAVGPDWRQEHAMSYDGARGVVVLYGGGFLAQTWEWDGNSWTQRFPASSPPPLASHGMVYDAGRQRTVLFGGAHAFEPGPLVLAETWEWDGVDWVKHTPQTSPPARTNFGMAYDVARQRVVVFGGTTGVGFFGDTWEWDGVDWVQQSPAVSPEPRMFPAMAYDPGLGLVVLFGGFSASGYPSDIWGWDGSEWIPLITMASPAGRQNHAMVYDSTRQHVVLVGGNGPEVIQPEVVWILGSEIPHTEAYGSGCPGSHGTPRLDGFGEPSVGNSSFALDLSSARPGAPAAVALSTGAANQQFGACTLLVDPSTVAVAPVLSNGAGFVSVRIPVPDLPNLIGVELYAQAVILDPAGALSLVASNGVSITVGS